MPEYWHPNSVEWLTGKLSVNQNLNPHDDVVLLSYMCMFTKLKQSSHFLKRGKILKLLYLTWRRNFFLNSDGIRVDKMQYSLAYGS